MQRGVAKIPPGLETELEWLDMNLHRKAVQGSSRLHRRSFSPGTRGSPGTTSRSPRRPLRPANKGAGKTSGGGAGFFAVPLPFGVVYGLDLI